MAINGVPTYGAQEGGSTNAVEPSPGAQITDAQFWYGHAGKCNSIMKLIDCRFWSYNFLTLLTR